MGRPRLCRKAVRASGQPAASGALRLRIAVTLSLVDIGDTDYPRAMCAAPLTKNIDNPPVANEVTTCAQGPASATVPVDFGKISTGSLVEMEPFS